MNAFLFTSDSDHSLVDEGVQCSDALVSTCASVECQTEAFEIEEPTAEDMEDALELRNQYMEQNLEFDEQIHRLDEQRVRLTTLQANLEEFANRHQLISRLEDPPADTDEVELAHFRQFLTQENDLLSNQMVQQNHHRAQLSTILSNLEEQLDTTLHLQTLVDLLTAMEWVFRQSGADETQETAIEYHGLPAECLDTCTTIHRITTPQECGPCVICLTDLEVSDTVRRLPCRHHYHPTCIEEWFDHSPLCPICKQDVVPPNEPSTEAV
eukprot:NODE_4138_length_836_cov_22.425952_g3980_i0.p1 GENE.NODE_4138_length_836_cov_22.425952_g3980_i0~~NODE_4138_length_836_cov_22.425952_g3980_i0.p1  ORF type:complete len:278 (+),score=74.03 NODE_4138_length_836_cov_22.425952_g3980_i0:31-834(+)